MSKTNKTILVVVLTLFIILGLIGVIWLGKGGTKKVPSHHTIFKDTKTIDSCYDQNYCGKPIESVYQYFESDIKNKKVQNWITKTNEETEKLYQKSNTSKATDSSCTYIKDMYKHDIRYTNDYAINSHDHYLSLSSKSFYENFCTGEREDMQVNALIYNLKKGKVLTQTEFMKELKITEEDVIKAIKNNISQMNQGTDEKLTFENTYQDGKPSYVLYYGSDGALLASYFQKEDSVYYAAIVK